MTAQLEINKRLGEVIDRRSLGRLVFRGQLLKDKHKDKGKEKRNTGLDLSKGSRVRATPKAYRKAKKAFFFFFFLPDFFFIRLQE